MIRFGSFTVCLALGVAGCVADSETSELRYTGSMQVTQQTLARDGATSVSIFGLITIPSELTATATTGGCDYHATRQPAGVTLGPLTVTGIGDPVVVEPVSFIDGMLYLATLGASHQLQNGAVVEAVIDDSSGPVSVQAAAPLPLATVVLPTSVSATNGGTITWHPGSGDEVEISLEVSRLGVEQSLRCRTSDTGSFAIPAEALALIDRAYDPDAMIFVTRRNLGRTSSEAADVVVHLALESEVFDSVQLEP